MRTTMNNRMKGFTLAEALAASTILSGAVLTMVAIGTQCISNTRNNRNYERAVLLADRQLAIIDYVGIDDFIEMGRMQGVIEDYQPGFAWNVVATYQEIDGLYLVSLTMTWVEGGKPRTLVVDTMLNGTNPYEQEESTTGGGGGGN